MTLPCIKLTVCLSPAAEMTSGWDWPLPPPPPPIQLSTSPSLLILHWKPSKHKSLAAASDPRRHSGGGAEEDTKLLLLSAAAAAAEIPTSSSSLAGFPADSQAKRAAKAKSRRRHPIFIFLIFSPQFFYEIAAAFKRSTVDGGRRTGAD